MTRDNPKGHNAVVLTTAERLSPQIARLIREIIMSGEAPGHAHLRTEHLAARFGVSATPIREALMSLYGEGLVDFQPGRGFRVVPMTRQDLLDLYDALAYYAGELTARATMNLTDRDLEQLAMMQGQFVAAIDAGDHAASEQIEFDLHRLINHAANAPKLRSLLKTALRYVPFRTWNDLTDWSITAPQDHLPILRALAHRSPLTARDAMTAHVRSVADMLADLLAERGVLAEDNDNGTGADRLPVPGLRWPTPTSRPHLHSAPIDDQTSP